MLQTLTNSFHVIVDMAFCVMLYGIGILTDVFGNNREKTVLCKKMPIKYLFSRIFCIFAAHSQ